MSEDMNCQNDGARLGLATTKELLEELTARIELDGLVGGGGLGYTTVARRQQSSEPDPVA